MISYVKGNLFESPAQTLVNTVNTVGVMGKGIALRFKQIYPEMFEEYQHLCEKGQLKIGMLHVYRTPNKLVLNFPTKESWRRPSRLSYIEAGLQRFRDSYREAGIQSVAFPPLGCGNGELDFDDVRPLMESYLADLPIAVYIYAPLPGKVMPEHRTPEEIREWLRSEVRYLSFNEVWEDVTELLRDREEFQTLTNGTTFRAKLLSEGEGAIRVHASGNVHRIDREDLRELWRLFRQQQVLTTRSAAGSLAKQLSYVFPVLAELPYVTAIEMADNYDDVQTNPPIGIQLLPTIAGEEVAQLQLIG
jgi:O-acetyl-ADP-ribose deacetylase (regulator of RNase III)